MGDLFHDDIPRDFITRVLDVMRATPQHTYYLLTKRAKNMHECLSNYAHWPLPNVNFGVSSENQRRLDERIHYLVETPVHNKALRYLSCEPLLGPIKIGAAIHSLGWVICGAERGPNKTKLRLAKDEWFSSLTLECRRSGVPLYHHRSRDKERLQKPQQQEISMDVKILDDPKGISASAQLMTVDRKVVDHIGGFEVRCGGQTLYILLEGNEATILEPVNVPAAAPPPKPAEPPPLTPLDLLRLRLDSNKTLKEMASDLGICDKTLSAMESGSRSTREGTLDQVERKLQVKLARHLFEDQWNWTEEMRKQIKLLRPRL